MLAGVLSQQTTADAARQEERARTRIRVDMALTFGDFRRITTA